MRPCLQGACNYTVITHLLKPNKMTGTKNGKQTNLQYFANVLRII